MSIPPPLSAPSPSSPPSPPADAASPPPSTTTSPPPPPPADSPPPSTAPPADSPPPTSTSPPPPPADSPPPTTTPPADTPPPTAATPTPPENSPPAPPSPPSGSSPSPPSGSSPSPPSPPSGGGRSAPPPPPTRSGGGALTPPGSGNEGSSPPSQSENGEGISTGVVVGVAVAAVLILGLISLFCICCFKNKKKKRRRNDGFYLPPPPGPKAGAYGGQMQQHHWQPNPPPPADHVVNMPPKLTPPPGGAYRPPSPQHPHLAAPYVSSSGDSNYSGGEPLTPVSPGMAFTIAKSSFSYDELAMASDGFSDANLLGQGGFGYVHRGVLPNGKEVAIKQLKAGSGQGEREFQAEVEIISRVHHKHLVSLVGYCITGSSRMLVYEFVPNNTLEFHLHGKGRPTMDWGSRLKIAVGSAKGLAYLHEDCHPKIIHRDIKAANILMDFNFEAKVADFGLARFSPEFNTHVSTRVMGTFGYLAPEYAATGKLTDKSDVFSFGVVLLELITGRRPVDSNQSYMDDCLVDWARPLLTRSLEDNNFNALVDQRIRNEYNQTEMARMVACAAACVRHSAKRRPRMSQVVRALDGDASLSDLNEGIKPGHSTVYGSYESSDYDAAQYKEDMIKIRKMALASQEFASSEYSGGAPTSEYGLNPSVSSSGQTTRELTTREMEMAKTAKDSKGYSSGY